MPTYILSNTDIYVELSADRRWGTIVNIYVGLQVLRIILK